MKCGNEISSSEDKFDFSLLKNEIMSICVTPDDGEKESSDGDSDEVRGINRRKIRVIESECESDSGSAVETEIPEWKTCTESVEIPQRIPGEKSVGQRVSSDLKEPLDFLSYFLPIN